MSSPPPMHRLDRLDPCESSRCRKARSPLLRSLTRSSLRRTGQAASREVTTASAASFVPAALRRIYAGEGLPRASGEEPRIVVVGAGLAGLNAAWLLQRAGCRAQVFDAAPRVGGRVRTDVGSFAPGQVTEFGGEFVDQSHGDLLALAAHFGLGLIDTRAASEAALEVGYFFGGRHRSEAEVIAAFDDIAPYITRDAARLSSDIRYDRHTPVDVDLDRRSLAEYLDGLGVAGWLRALLDVGFTTEFGLDADEQSCLSFLSMIDTDTSQGFAMFGDSDQRFKIHGGNGQIVERLAQPLGSHLQLGHRLVAMARRGEGFRLQFACDDAATRAVDADIVLLALPFSLLRQVDLTGVLPPKKQAAIDRLAYGTNAKVIVGLDQRVWRMQGRDGDLFSDLPGQTGWDASRQRDGDGGVFTFYLGGEAGVACGRGTPEQQAALSSRPMDAVFAGFNAASTGHAARVHWPSEPFALGSYGCSKPGDATSFGGIEGRRVGRIHFAGEHCSRAFQGYMNGAAESGRRAAIAILQSLR